MWCSMCPLNAIRCDCLQLQFNCCSSPAQQHPDSRLHKDNDDNATGNMHSDLIWQGHALNAISTTRRQFGRYFKLCKTACETITIGPLCDIQRVRSCVFYDRIHKARYWLQCRLIFCGKSYFNFHCLGNTGMFDVVLMYSVTNLLSTNLSHYWNNALAVLSARCAYFPLHRRHCLRAGCSRGVAGLEINNNQIAIASNRNELRSLSAC